MHRLVRVHIKNFRSCKLVELRLHACTPLVGYNNAGKSNLLSAIDWLLAPKGLSTTDYCDESQPVVVEALIGGLTQDVLDGLDASHKKRIEPLVKGECLWVRRVQQTPGASSKAIKLEIADSGAEVPEGWREPPTGIPEALKALFPEPIFVRAMQDSAEDATKAKTSTTLGKLLSGISADLQRSHAEDFERALEPLARLLSPLGGDDRSEHLRRFDEQATAALAAFFPGIRLHLDIPLPDAESTFKAGTIRVREEHRDGISAFTELGHGAQRSIQMALIKYLADVRREKEKPAQTRLLLIEEPELFLHPQAIEQVRAALMQLSSMGYQVVFATHTPLMINRAIVHHTVIVRKAAASPLTQIAPLVEEALEARVDNYDKRLYMLFELKNASEWLFSDRVVFVEGKTEIRTIPSLVEGLDDATLTASKVALVEMQGKGMASPCLDVMDEIGLDSRAVVDLDFAFDQAVKSRILDENDHDLQEALSQLQTMAQEDSSIHLGDNGRPAKADGCRKPAEVYREWAATPNGKKVAKKLHEKFKEYRIWLWPMGDIEAHLGLSGPKNEATWAQFCSRLEEEGVRSSISDVEGMTSFIEWMLKPSRAHALVEVGEGAVPEAAD